MDSTTWQVIAVIVIPLTALLLVAWQLRKISQERKAGFPIRDERTLMISRKAATYAYGLGVYFMAALLFFFIIGREFFDMPEYSASSLLMMLIMVFNLGFLAFRYYFNREKDIE